MRNKMDGNFGLKPKEISNVKEKNNKLNVKKAEQISPKDVGSMIDKETEIEEQDFIAKLQSGFLKRITRGLDMDDPSDYRIASDRFYDEYMKARKDLVRYMFEHLNDILQGYEAVIEIIEYDEDEYSGDLVPAKRGFELGEFSVMSMLVADRQVEITPELSRNDKRIIPVIKIDSPLGPSIDFSEYIRDFPHDERVIRIVKELTPRIDKLFSQAIAEYEKKYK